MVCDPSRGYLARYAGEGGLGDLQRQQDQERTRTMRMKTETTFRTGSAFRTVLSGEDEEPRRRFFKLPTLTVQPRRTSGRIKELDELETHQSTQEQHPEEMMDLQRGQEGVVMPKLMSSRHIVANQNLEQNDHTYLTGIPSPRKVTHIATPHGRHSTRLFGPPVIEEIPFCDASKGQAMLSRYVSRYSEKERLLARRRLLLQ
jgi:hypothetical protein